MLTSMFLAYYIVKRVGTVTKTHDVIAAVSPRSTSLVFAACISVSDYIRQQRTSVRVKYQIFRDIYHETDKVVHVKRSHVQMNVIQN